MDNLSPELCPVNFSAPPRVRVAPLFVPPHVFFIARRWSTFQPRCSRRAVSALRNCRLSRLREQQFDRFVYNIRRLVCLLRLSVMPL